MAAPKYKLYLQVGRMRELEGCTVQVIDVQDAEAFDRMWRTQAQLSAEKLVSAVADGTTMTLDKSTNATKVSSAELEVLDWGPQYVAVCERATKLHAGCFDHNAVDEEYIRQVKAFKNGVVLERRLYDDGSAVRLAYCECAGPQERWADVASAHIKKAGF